MFGSLNFNVVQISYNQIRILYNFLPELTRNERGDVWSLGPPLPHLHSLPKFHEILMKFPRILNPHPQQSHFLFLFSR
jgi:hypothetical protein